MNERPSGAMLLIGNDKQITKSSISTYYLGMVDTSV